MRRLKSITKIHELCVMKFRLLYTLSFLFFGGTFAQVPDDLICAEKANVISRIQRRGISTISHGYNIDYHRCNWYVNPLKNAFFKGSVLFKFTVVQDADSLGVDIVGGLNVTHIVYHGSHTNFSRNGDALYVYKTGKWNKNTHDSFEIFYEGFPANGSGFGSFVYDNHKTGPVIHTLSQPYGAPSWWPCKQTLHDKIDSIDIFVHTDKSLKVGSNGLLIDTTSEGDTAVVFHWRHRYPIATYLVAIAVTNYDEFTHFAKFRNYNDSMPVLNYVFPQFKNTAFEETKPILPMLRLFDSLFTRYPFIKEKYGHAQFTWGGGMEHQTMSFMVNFSFDLMAHELAHMWFGDMVTCGSWQDLWLNEGFATYLTCLTYEFLKSPVEFRTKLRGMRNDICSDPNGSVCPSDTSKVNVLFNGRLTYNKGAWVLHMLRNKIGDSAFFKGCRNYLSGSNAYGFGYTPELQAEMEKASGMDLTVFFQQWFFGEGFPYLKINWNQVGGKMKVKIDQTPSNAEVPFWFIKVPILFQNKTTSKLITFEPSLLKDSFTFDLPFSCDTAIFDPNVTVLAKAAVGGVNQNTIQDEEIWLLPNPGTDILQVYSRNPNLKKIEIYNSIGDKVKEAVLNQGTTGNMRLDMSQFACGTYFIRINTENLVYLKKWLKI